MKKLARLEHNPLLKVGTRDRDILSLDCELEHNPDLTPGVRLVGK